MFIGCIALVVPSLGNRADLTSTLRNHDRQRTDKSNHIPMARLSSLSPIHICRIVIVCTGSKSQGRGES